MPCGAGSGRPTGACEIPGRWTTHRRTQGPAIDVSGTADTAGAAEGEEEEADREQSELEVASGSSMEQRVAKRPACKPRFGCASAGFARGDKESWVTVLNQLRR